MGILNCVLLCKLHSVADLVIFVIHAAWLNEVKTRTNTFFAICFCRYTNAEGSNSSYEFPFLVHDSILLMFSCDF